MNRRYFLRSAGLLAGATQLAGFSALARAAAANNPFGIQLYTLRADLPAGPDAVITQLASFGYKQIESYEGPMGMFWGKTPAEFGRFITDLGMDLLASHCSIEENFEQKAAQAAEAGMEYLICPMIGSQESLDEYKRFAERFNRCGEICRDVGLKFGYHNHHYSFFEMDGQIPQDVMMQNTDPALVEYELDIFWLVAAGQDPLVWLRKYPGRFTFSHVKDRLPDQPSNSFTASTTLGQGFIDYASILPVAKELGMKYFIVEQEAFAGTTPIDSSRDNAAYMRNLNV